ncbi:hypothetical protein PPTG_01500 [Phytophthora nicotianae INRA-310]|uniref:DDE Tnp4 domain-containing protein n=1 Tax=Phytophthora nicotianae (strain INRA-310) TaxID=761204 RepID=W2R7N8_PHYN3|nr:hypothetical protein PPTG_01500 [Phytophthora nicotianae INRA-310]ETN21261.1 hypothetical protein PPTG_01500 [Phytophthora nicotianae INRA-310]
MFPALNVQAVVDHRMRFTSVKIRPGLWSDQKIWRAAALGSTYDKYLPTGTPSLVTLGTLSVQ